MEYFSPTQVSKICNVAPSTVIRWIQKGHLKASTTGGGHHRVLPHQLVDFMNTRNIPVPHELKNKKTMFKVLIVDDDANLRKLIRKSFEAAFPSIWIEEADGGFEAGWRAQAQVPDLVILDILLPGFDGYGTCQLFRTIPELKDLKILAITGQEDPQVKDRILSCGANDFLQKPFELKTLIDKVVTLFKNRVGVGDRYGEK